MKKVLVLSLMAIALIACEEKELESAENTLIELRENDKQSAKWKLLNSKIIGAKDDAPQGKQSDYPKNKEN